MEARREVLGKTREEPEGLAMFSLQMHNPVPQCRVEHVEIMDTTQINLGL